MVHRDCGAVQKARHEDARPLGGCEREVDASVSAVFLVADKDVPSGRMRASSALT